jgi:hypothetical protein
MAPTRPRITRPTRGRTLPQPQPSEWSAALVPSQRRAADQRSQLERRRSAERWLRDLAHR